MAIHIDIITRLNQRGVKRDADAIRREMERLGKLSGDAWAKGIEEHAPKVQKALQKAAKSTDTLRVAESKSAVTKSTLSKLSKELRESEERLGRERARAASDLDAKVAISERRLAESRRLNEKLAREGAKAESELAEAREEGDTDKIVRGEQRLATLRERQERALTSHMARLKSHNAVLREEADAVEFVTRAERDHMQVQQRHSAVVRQLEQDSRRLASATRDEAVAVRDGAHAMNEHEDSLRRNGSLFKEVSGDVKSFVGSMVGLRFAGGTGTVAMTALAGAVVELIKILATASQSILGLPAALTALGAGMGTLKLATAGFSDTIEQLAKGDLEKFAENIQKLSPNAQQAALSIQAIWDKLQNLQRSTQDSFFEGIGAQIERLSTQYLPSLQTLTTNIADSFNRMFKGIADELMTPQMQANMQQMFGNLQETFRELVPAARDFVRAFLDMASSGSNVLPGLARSIADMARGFADFIRDAAETGKLQTWIQEGIDAIGLLADAIWTIGEIIFAVFNRDGKANIDSFKEDVESLHDTLDFLRGDFSVLGKSIADDFIGVARQGLKDFIVDIPEAMAVAINKTVEYLNGFIDRVNSLLMTSWLGKIVGFMTGQGLQGLPTIPHIPQTNLSGGDWAPYTGTPEPIPARTPGTYRDRYGNERRIPGGTQPGVPQVMRPVPSPPPEKGGKNPLNIPREKFSLESIPLGQFPGSTGQYGNLGPMGPMGPSGWGAPQGSQAGLQPAAKNLWDVIAQQFPEIQEIGGVRQDRLPYHPSGRALDIMIPGEGGLNDPTSPAGKALGDQIYQFLTSNADLLGVDVQGTLWQVKDHFNHIHAQLRDQTQQFMNLGPGMAGPAGVNPVGQAGPVDPQRVYDAETRVAQSKQQVEDARLRVLELEADGNADQNDLNKARNNVVIQERQYYSDMQDLYEAQTGTSSKMQNSAKSFTDGMQQIGAELDKDFGISKGLPGLAENITKFLANLAFAPVLGALSGVTAAYGTAGPGTGLLGMFSPRENVFGQPMPNVLGQYSEEQLQQMMSQMGMPSMMGQQPQYPGIGSGIGSPSLTAAFQNAGIPAEMYSVLSAFASVEGNNPAGIPTLGFTDTQAGTTLDQHAQALANQLQDRQSVAGPFPSGGSAQDQAAWIATIVGQQGLASDWQGNAQPARSDYINRIINSMFFQNGGTVPGFGNGDKVPALLEPGELVVPKDMVGMQEGGWVYDPNYGRTEPNAGAGIEPSHTPPPRRRYPGEGRRPPPHPGTGGTGPFPGNPIPSRLPGETPGPFAVLPGQKPPGSTAGGFNPYDVLTQNEYRGGVPPWLKPGPQPGEVTPGFEDPLMAPLGGGPRPALPAPKGPTPRQATPWVGRSPGEGVNIPHGGGIGPSGGGLLGLPMAAAQGAAGAFPGGAVASAAAQIAIDEINRAIQYGGQLVGIGVQGLMETFLPNESALADPFAGWFGRITAAAAGVGSAAPNIAGMLGQKAMEGQAAAAGEQPGVGGAAGLGLAGPGSVPGPLTPEQANIGGINVARGATAVNTNTNNVTVNNNGATPDQNGAAITWHLGRSAGGTVSPQRGR